MKALSALAPEVKQYLLVTGNYWAFTLTDGALRMLVVLHFHSLGYSPLQIAALFLFYEIFGVVTNLVGGYLGARLGLNRTMNIGLAMQVVALLMLTVPAAWLTVPWAMGAQALSGIAKDLNKMSAKSSIKLLVPDAQQGTLYKWVAILTGSKNALKGVGFFLGGALLAVLGFAGAVLTMAGVLAVIWIASLFLLKKDLGKAKAKPKFKDILSKSRAINILSAARLFLFGARDVWFVVALPVYLSTVFGWAGAGWPCGIPLGGPAGRYSRCHRPGPGWRFTQAGGAGGRTADLRRRVCHQLVAAQLPDRQLRQGRRRVAGCRFLLHVQRAWPAGRDAVVRLGLPAIRPGSLPVGLQHLCRVGRADIHRSAQASAVGELSQYPIRSTRHV